MFQKSLYSNIIRILIFKHYIYKYIVINNTFTFSDNLTAANNYMVRLCFKGLMKSRTRADDTLLLVMSQN